LLQDWMEKVYKWYTSFEELIKLIELDDDVEGTVQEYKYDLNKALEDSELSKKANENNSKNINSTIPTQQVSPVPNQQTNTNPIQPNEVTTNN
jgi:hypothetical protein